MPSSEEDKARARRIRTLRGLKRANPNLAALDGLDAEALAFAADNPEHSEAGRAAARAALVSKVGEAEADRLIGAFIDNLPPPGWIKVADLDARDSPFFGSAHWLRRVVGWAANIALIVTLAIIFTNTSVETEGFKRAVEAGVIPRAEFEEAIRQPTTEESDANPTAHTTAKRAALRQKYPLSEPFFAEHERLNELGGGAMTWAMILFPAYTILIGLRQRPARVLLLRRFNDRSVDRAIARLSRRSLKPYGHVFTLADRYFKRSWLALAFSWFSLNPFLLVWRIINIPVGLVIRVFDRSRAGPIMIWSARDFRHFVKRLTDRYGLNLEVARTRRNAVMVRTSDAWWQHVVLLLMHASDVIVVDVTEVAAGTAWELETMLHEDVEERIVFIARADQEADARASLIAHGFPNAPLFTYKQNGRPSDNKSFKQEIIAAMRRKLSEPA